MDYKILAKKVLSLYPISNPEIEFIRHNENITFKVTDKLCNRHYLLRIHKPAIEGLFGIQHTFEGVKSEIKILQELSKDSGLKVQKPIANCSGEYVTEYSFSEFSSPCYSTLLEWIEGSTLTLKEDNIEEIAFALGQNFALFHKCSREFKPEKDFKRPIYDTDRIDSAIEDLKYCVEVNLFSKEQYDLIKEVLILIKSQIKELDLKGNTWGIIHADIQPGNVVINNGNPCLIDFGFSGFGYYLFDLGSAATIFEGNLRKIFLQGYASKSSFSFEDLKYIEGFVFMDIFITYVMFMRSEDNAWINESATDRCNNVCKKFLAGEEVFYDL